MSNKGDFMFSWRFSDKNIAKCEVVSLCSGVCGAGLQFLTTIDRTMAPVMSFIIYVKNH
jgi:hypothetical protein